MVLSIAILALFSSYSFAAKCPGADVRMDRAGGSMELVKPRNQEQMNTCMAFAAAEAWDAFRFSHYDQETLKKEKGFYTIPMQGALGVNLKREKPSDQLDWKNAEKLPFEGKGDQVKILNYFMSNPTCVSDKTTDEIFSDLPGKNRIEKMAYLQTLIDQGEQVSKLMAGYLKKSVESPDQKIALATAYTKKYLELVKEADTAEMDACFKKGSLDNFVSEYMKDARFSDNSLSNIFNALMKSCERKSAMVAVKKIPKIYSGAGTGVNVNTLNGVNSVMMETPAQAANNIHQALSGKFGAPTQPVMLDVCDNFLKKGKEYEGPRRQKDGTVDVGTLGPDAVYHRCDRHSLLAIGRKSEGDQCKILLRNTWRKCKEKPYSSDWKCDEQGDDVWVDEETLFKSTLNYTFIGD